MEKKWFTPPQKEAMKIGEETAEKLAGLEKNIVSQQVEMGRIIFKQMQELYPEQHRYFLDAVGSSLQHEHHVYLKPSELLARYKSDRERRRYEQCVELVIVDLLGDYGNRFIGYLPRIYRFSTPEIRGKVEERFNIRRNSPPLLRIVPKVLNKYDLDFEDKPKLKRWYKVKLRVKDVKTLQRARGELEEEIMTLR